MACGTPVIVSSATSLPEIVGEDGIQVEPLDVSAWCEAIAALLDAPSRRADLAVRVSARAMNFSWDRTAEQTVRAYRAALDTRID
jgi:glycosyltransferase involved in cell wall biosynthesis